MASGGVAMSAKNRPSPAQLRVIMHAGATDRRFPKTGGGWHIMVSSAWCTQLTMRILVQKGWVEKLYTEYALTPAAVELYETVRW